MTTYCLKCKKKTANNNSQIVKDPKTGKPRQKSTCSICGTNKSKFIKDTSKNTPKTPKAPKVKLPKKDGSGLIGNLVGSKIPVLGDIPLLNILF